MSLLRLPREAGKIHVGWMTTTVIYLNNVYCGKQDTKAPTAPLGRFSGHLHEIVAGPAQINLNERRSCCLFAK